MIEATSAELATAFDRLTLILAGLEKSGKSRLAATARKPILFHDHDKRFGALAGIPGVYGLTYKDSMAPGQQPTAYSDHLTVLSMLESGATLKHIGDKFGKPGWPDVPPKTQVEDSMASLAAEIMAHNLFTNVDLRRTINISGLQLHFPKSFDAWNSEIASAYNIVMRLIAMQSMDVILIFHEESEEAPQSTPEKKVMTGKKALFPARYKQFNRYINEVWRVSRESGSTNAPSVPTIQMTPDWQFAASTNFDFSKLSPKDIVPDISRMIDLVIPSSQKLLVGK